jgi:hypothetical protein
MRKTIIFLIMLIALPSVLAISAGTQEVVHHFDACDSLDVTVTGTLDIVSGEYWFVNCTNTSTNSWSCLCFDGYDLKIETLLNTINTYNITMNYQYGEEEVIYYSGGGGGGIRHPTMTTSTTTTTTAKINLTTTTMKQIATTTTIKPVTTTTIALSITTTTMQTKKGNDTWVVYIIMGVVALLILIIAVIVIMKKGDKNETI